MEELSMVTIVYIHGFLSSSLAEKTIALNKHFKTCNIRFIAVDLYPTEEDFTNATLQSLADQVHLTLSRLDDAVILVGSSLGGLISLQYMATYPEFVPKALLLLAPALWFQKILITFLNSEILIKWQSDGWIPFRHPKFRDKTPLNYTFFKSLAESKVEKYRPPTVTKIIHGSNDDTVPLSNSKRYQKLFPHVNLRIVNDGHRLVKSFDIIIDELELLMK